MPVLPSPLRYGKDNNGLKLIVYGYRDRVPEGTPNAPAGPVLEVGLHLAQLEPCRILNIEKHGDFPFWLFLFNEKDVFLGMRPMRPPKDFEAIIHEASKDFILLDLAGKPEIRCFIRLPWQLDKGTYKVLVGFDPFQHIKENPPDTIYWQGEVISKMTEIKLPASE